MVVVLLFASLAVFLLAGIPIAFALALPSVIYFIIYQIPLGSIAQVMISATDSFPLMAAPLFMVAGLLMSYGGSTTRFLNLSNAAVGHLRGGLGHVCVVSSMIFAGMTGSATAEVAGLGIIEIKMMTDAGYDKRFSAAVTAASAMVGPIIPPSVPFVIYGALAQVSVGKLLLGGAIPGIIMGLYMMGIVWWVAEKKKLSKRRFVFN